MSAPSFACYVLLRSFPAAPFTPQPPIKYSPSQRRVYYGSEWLYNGGSDPDCREPLWNTGVSYDAAKAPLGPFLAALNGYRKRNSLWNSKQVRQVMQRARARTLE